MMIWFDQLTWTISQITTTADAADLNGGQASDASLTARVATRAAAIASDFLILRRGTMVKGEDGGRGARASSVQHHMSSIPRARSASPARDSTQVAPMERLWIVRVIRECESMVIYLP